MNPVNRLLGLIAAGMIAVLEVLYGLVLTAGLMSLPSADVPIGGPFFAILEILILIMAPAIVVLFVAIHFAAPLRTKPLTLISVIFASWLTGITCCVHFTIITLSRTPEFAEIGAVLI